MSAILGHFFLLVALVPIFLLCTYLLSLGMVNDFNLGIFLLFAFFVGYIYFTLKMGFSFSDIYVEGDTIITQKLWGSKRRSMSELEVIDQPMILPLIYYIVFKDGRKHYFYLDSSIIPRHLTSNDSNRTLKELRLMFR